MKKNGIIRLIVAAFLWLSLIGIAQAADRYVYDNGNGWAEGVCDDSTTDGFHTQLHASAVYVETWDDGISNGLDALEVGTDDSYSGTYHVATLNGSGEKVYLVL